MIEIFIIATIGLVLCYATAEVFGRSKHIGRGWSFVLLATSLVFGIVAILVSPSAKQKPTEGHFNHKLFGWISVVIGLLSGLALNPAALGFMVLGLYLIQLSEGEIENDNPKFYFNSLNSNSSKGHITKDTIINGDKTEDEIYSYKQQLEELKELKDIGVFNEVEYLKKKKIITDKIKLNEIEKSTEYKSLKTLYESGVLSEKEFNDKIKAIKILMSKNSESPFNSLEKD